MGGSGETGTLRLARIGFRLVTRSGQRLERPLATMLLPMLYSCSDLLEFYRLVQTPLPDQRLDGIFNRLCLRFCGLVTPLFQRIRRLMLARCTKPADEARRRKVFPDPEKNLVLQATPLG